MRKIAIVFALISILLSSNVHQVKATSPTHTVCLSHPDWNTYAVCYQVEKTSGAKDIQFYVGKPLQPLYQVRGFGKSEWRIDVSNRSNLYLQEQGNFSVVAEYIE